MLVHLKSFFLDETTQNETIKLITWSISTDVKNLLEKLSEAGRDDKMRHLVVKREALMENAQNPTAVPSAVLLLAIALKSFVY